MNTESMALGFGRVFFRIEIDMNICYNKLSKL